MCQNKDYSQITKVDIYCSYIMIGRIVYIVQENSSGAASLRIREELVYEWK